MYFLLEYDYVTDIIERREAFREQHLTQAQALTNQNKLHMAGACGNPITGALFIFKDVSEDEIETFVKNDPYFINGLITGWRIIPWTVVVGN